MAVNKKLTLFIGKSRKSTPILGILQEFFLILHYQRVRGKNSTILPLIVIIGMILAIKALINMSRISVEAFFDLNSARTSPSTG